MKGAAALPTRTRLWLASVVLSLGFYCVRATHLPRRTAVGVERRVLAGTGYAVLHSPVANQWLVSIATSIPVVGLQPNPQEWLATALWKLEWPAGRDTGRRLRPFREHGTWSIGDLGVRRVWRFRAEPDVVVGRYLIAAPEHHRALPGSDFGAPILDLRSRRTLNHAVDVEWPELWEGQYTVNAEANGLEGITGELTVAMDVEVGGRRMSLWGTGSETAPQRIVVVPDEPNPRVLSLVENAIPITLSRDGRTLLFERDNALWRLDLRRPLPELLDEAAPPPLPDTPN